MQTPFYLFDPKVAELHAMRTLGFVPLVSEREFYYIKPVFSFAGLQIVWIEIPQTGQLITTWKETDRYLTLQSCALHHIEFKHTFIGLTHNNTIY